MEFTTISSFQHPVSRIGLGTWAMGGSLWGESDENESIATIIKALEIGINLIDSAPGYGNGHSERIIGKALKICGKRENILIATKCGLNLAEENHVYRDSRTEMILKELDASLERLQVDYIDIYQIHWPDPYTPHHATASVLHELLAKGKIRAIGVSNYTLDEIKEFRKSAPLHIIQHPFNLFERETEQTILSYCKSEGLTSLGYSSLCRGLLAGTLTKDFIFEDLRKNFDPKFREPRYSQYLMCVGRLKQWVLSKYNRSLPALALRWSLDKGVDVALLGARRPVELIPLDEVFGWTLTQEDFEEIDQIIKESVVDPIGPEFMSPPLREQNL